MKQVTTFSGSEVLAALSLYNKVAKHFDIPGVSLIDLMQAGFTQKDEHTLASIEVSMSGDITMITEVDSQSMIKLINVFSKYVDPICGVVKGLITMFKSLKPMLGSLESDIQRTMRYKDAAYVARGEIRKHGVDAEPTFFTMVQLDFPSDITDILRDEILAEEKELSAKEIIDHCGDVTETSYRFKVIYHIVNGKTWKVIAKEE